MCNFLTGNAKTQLVKIVAQRTAFEVMVVSLRPEQCNCLTELYMLLKKQSSQEKKPGATWERNIKNVCVCITVQCNLVDILKKVN